MKYLAGISALLLVAALLAGCDPVGQASSSMESSNVSIDPLPTASQGVVESPKPEDADSVATDPVAPEPVVDDGRPLDKTFDDIKFDIEPGGNFARDMLTPQITALNGRTMTIRGYILPTPQKRGIQVFVLVRDNLECCFGPGAALYDCILVEMNKGRTAEFSLRPVSVTGTFRIEEYKIGGELMAIYQMAGETVK